MRYTVQGSKFGNYIQTYATVLENTLENFRIGEPTLLLVKLIAPEAKEYTYYTHYGGGSGKLNIAVPEWLAKPGKAIEMFFEKIDAAKFVNAIPSITLSRPDDDRVNSNKIVIEKVLLEGQKVKLHVTEYSNKKEKQHIINCHDPMVGYDPRGVEIKTGSYAGAPYIQFNLKAKDETKTLRIYHNHGIVRLAIASGRNFYTVRFLEKENSELKILYEKKEEKTRLVLAKLQLGI